MPTSSSHMQSTDVFHHHESSQEDNILNLTPVQNNQMHVSTDDPTINVSSLQDLSKTS